MLLSFFVGLTLKLRMACLHLLVRTSIKHVTSAAVLSSLILLFALLLMLLRPPTPLRRLSLLLLTSFPTTTSHHPQVRCQKSNCCMFLLFSDFYYSLKCVRDELPMNMMLLIMLDFLMTSRG